MSTSLKPNKTDLKELQQHQIEADGDFSASQEEKTTGNLDGSYKLPTHEAHLIHLQLSREVHDPAAKKYNTDSKVVALSPAEYERMKHNGSFNEYDAQELLHDPRSAAVRKASQTGDVPTGDPSQAKKPLASLQDAHMRYKELTKQDAPTDKSFEELLALIEPLEAALHAKSSTGTTILGPRSTKSDYLARFRELSGEEAPADKTIDDLKQAIAHFESTK